MKRQIKKQMFMTVLTICQRLTRALWARITKSTDGCTGPLARPFARSLAPLTRLLALHYLLCSRAPLHSLARSLTHFAQFAYSLAHGTVNDGMAIYSVFFFYFGP